MRAVILGQIPYTDTTRSVATDDFSLIWVDNHVIHGRPMVVASLNASRPRLPDLDGSIFRACDHPFALAMERDACDVALVTFECQQRIRVGRLNIVQLHSMMASSGKVALVGGDAETIDLGIGVLDRSRADAGEGFPES